MSVDLSFAAIGAGQALSDFDPNWEALGVGGSFAGIPGGGALQSAGTDDTMARYLGSSFADDQFAEIVLGAGAGIAGFVGAAVRLSASGDGYGFTWSTAGTLYLNLFTGGDFITNFGSVSAVAGQLARVQVIGASLQVFLNGVLTALDFTDATYASGRPGLTGFGGGSLSTVAQWSAGSIAAAAVAGSLSSARRLKSLTGGALCT